MATTFEDLVKFGIQKEIDAEKFYRRWANLVTGPDRFWPRAKVLLLELANEEVNHQHFFEDLKGTALAKGDIPDTFDLRREDYASPALLKADACTKDVVQCAIDREDTAIRFYNTLAGLGGKAQTIFERLAQEEKGHKQRLENFHNEHFLTWD